MASPLEEETDVLIEIPELENVNVAPGLPMVLTVRGDAWSGWNRRVIAGSPPALTHSLSLLPCILPRSIWTRTSPG
jgi:hypothetical protein